LRGADGFYWRGVGEFASYRTVGHSDALVKCPRRANGRNSAPATSNKQKLWYEQTISEKKQRRNIMKIQRFAIALTLLNLALLIFLVVQNRKAEAQNVAPVLRGRELEIVDDQGRVRASIKVQPADPKAKTASGKPYPDTVILRLIDPNGRPEVKLGASEQGSGLGLMGETDSTYIVLKAEGPDSSLKMINQEGRQQVIKP